MVSPEVLRIASAMLERMADRCRQLTVTQGQGPWVLSPPESSFQALAAVASPGVDFPVSMVGRTVQGAPTGQWQTGYAQLDVGGALVLTAAHEGCAVAGGTVVLDTAIVWASATIEIFITPTARTFRDDLLPTTTPWPVGDFGLGVVGLVIAAALPPTFPRVVRWVATEEDADAQVFVAIVNERALDGVQVRGELHNPLATPIVLSGLAFDGDLLGDPFPTTLEPGSTVLIEVRATAGDGTATGGFTPLADGTATITVLRSATVPTHASTHFSNGSDQILPADIDAPDLYQFYELEGVAQQAATDAFDALNQIGDINDQLNYLFADVGNRVAYQEFSVSITQNGSGTVQLGTGFSQAFFQHFDWSGPDAALAVSWAPVYSGGHSTIVVRRTRAGVGSLSWAAGPLFIGDPLPTSMAQGDAFILRLSSRGTTPSDLVVDVSILRSASAGRFAQDIGDGVASTFTVAHNLGTRDVQVQVVRVAAPYDTVDVDVDRPDTNTVQVSFAGVPSSAEFRVIVNA